MPTNFYIFFLTALIPLVVGAIYYNPRVFGAAWMNINGFTEASLQAKGGNMAVIFGLTYLMGLMASFFIPIVTIHQGGVYGLMAPDIMESGSAAQLQFNELMAQYGNRYRDFGHGAIHGAFLSFFLRFFQLS